MEGQEELAKINVIELLMTIKSDVSSIKTDISNIKDTQSKERENITREIQSVRESCLREVASMEARVNGKITNLTAVQNNLVGDIDILKHKREAEEAKRYRTVLAFICTGIGGMVFAKLPDILKIIFGGN